MPVSQNKSLISTAGITERSLFDFALVGRLARAIEGRLAPLEAQRGALDDAIEGIQRVGLNRINEVLGPAIEAVLRIQERGFLIARSQSSATLAAGNVLSFFIEDEQERALFTPSPFTALTREATPNNYGVARTIAYDASNGEYLCEVISFEGDPGPHSDWVIAALAGSTVAQLAVLSDVLGAQQDVSALAGAAETSAQTAAQAVAAIGNAEQNAASSATAAGQSAQDAAMSATAAGQSAQDAATSAAAAAAANLDPANVALTGGTIDGTQIGGMQAAPGAFTTLQAQTYRETLGAVSGGALDLSTGSVFFSAPSVNTTYAFNAPPASGVAYGFTLRVAPTASVTLGWPAAVKWSAGTAPDAPAEGETSVFVFYTQDGGATYFGFVAGEDMS